MGFYTLFAEKVYFFAFFVAPFFISKNPDKIFLFFSQKPLTNLSWSFIDFYL